MTATIPLSAEVDRAHYDRRWWALVVLCLSLLIVFGGNSTLNVALPTLSRDLGATESQLQWVVASYSLVFAGLLFTTGALGDRYGRKGALQLGLLLFLVGAGLASLSNSMGQLIACRCVMGAAGALIMPATLSILVNTFPPHERPKAIAIWASVTGAAGALGPVASGYLLGHFWYGSIFLVNVPIIAIALVGGAYLVQTSRDPEQGKLDPLGAVLSIIGIVSLVYGLIQAPSNGWLTPTTLGAFAVAIVVLGLFVAWELRVAEPMLDMHYFKNPAFSTGTGGMILVFLSMYGVLFMITQYFQLVHGYSALGAALRTLPIAVIMIVVSPLTEAQRAVRRAPHRRVRDVQHLGRVRPARPARRQQPVCLHGRVLHPAHGWHRTLDVADDRVDHVGGPGPARGSRLGDERRDARARCRARYRRARQRRGVAIRLTDRALPAHGLTKLRSVRSPTRRSRVRRVADSLPPRAAEALTAGSKAPS